jgi:hypothetical protein
MNGGEHKLDLSANALSVSESKGTSLNSVLLLRYYLSGLAAC